MEEEKERGAVDGERHIWSYDKKDIINMLEPDMCVIGTKILRSRWFPRYRYCFPQLVVWAIKK